VIFLKERMEEFKYDDSKKTFVMAINYWWQDEILRAMKKLKDIGDEVSQENLEKYMDFWWLPTVDLVIRTKQRLAKRLSWFMLRWIGYAQLYFTDLYCPEFTVDEFEKAITRWRDSLGTQNFWK
jgi:undecaprenyl diphosphate synthase